MGTTQCLMFQNGISRYFIVFKITSCDLKDGSFEVLKWNLKITICDYRSSNTYMLNMWNQLSPPGNEFPGYNPSVRHSADVKKRLAMLRREFMFEK
ncbi:hypothetical protein CEE37_05180 [candidate division LCP-89 bacterium B3_LCP]|uniref:Uncharacterized protein n=1 Tax=candidate division LCP-89 bacterium B3_LCP TaxID=2012998 RepID=A0A532V1G8_UNCL8|nr:MAG: hypothetical protein CEE37_05180 [candidate division LCP-89 bacterium B3_LCP]